MGAAGKADIIWAQWLPFAGFAALCAWFYYVLAYVPGGQPISVAERGFARIGRLTKKLWRRKKLRDEPKREDED